MTDDEPEQIENTPVSEATSVDLSGNLAEPGLGESAARVSRDDRTAPDKAGTIRQAIEQDPDFLQQIATALTEHSLRR